MNIFNRKNYFIAMTLITPFLLFGTEKGENGQHQQQSTQHHQHQHHNNKNLNHRHYVHPGSNNKSFEAGAVTNSTSQSPVMIDSNSSTNGNSSGN